MTDLETLRRATWLQELDLLTLQGYRALVMVFRNQAGELQVISPLEEGLAEFLGWVVSGEQTYEPPEPRQ